MSPKFFANIVRFIQQASVICWRKCDNMTLLVLILSSTIFLENVFIDFLFLRVKNCIILQKYAVRRHALQKFSFTFCFWNRVCGEMIYFVKLNNCTPKRWVMQCISRRNRIIVKILHLCHVTRSGNSTGGRSHRQVVQLGPWEKSEYLLLETRK